MFNNCTVSSFSSYDNSSFNTTSNGDVYNYPGDKNTEMGGNTGPGRQRGREWAAAAPPAPAGRAPGAAADTAAQSTMRAPLLLPLLLLGVSSQDAPTSTVLGENGKIITTTTVTPTSKPGNPSSTSTMSTAGVQGTTLTENPLPTSVVSPTTGEVPTTTRRPPPASVTSSVTTEGPTSRNNPGNPPPIPTMSPHPSQQDSSSVSSGGSPAVPAVTSSAAQQQTSPSGNLGGLAATTAASLVLTHVSSTSATTGGLGPGVASSPSVEAQGSQPVDQLTSTAASTGVPMGNLPPGHKDYSVSSPTPISKQPHSSSSSPVPGLASSTTPGSTGISVTALDGPVSHTTRKPSLSLPPESTDKLSEATTTPTSGGDQRSPEAGSVPTSSADQSPASEHPVTPAQGGQPECSRCGHHHPNTSLQNEVICKDQVQNNLPNIYLKEPRTCAEWRTASTNNSFFESFCSTGQHTFNASREACTVILTSHEHHSQHWAVQTVLHIHLDPEKVLEDLKEKEKLEELGIANVTYDKREQEMIINDEFSTPLIITIVTLAGSLLLIAAIYGCCHQRFSQKKDQHIHPDLPGFDDGHVALIFNQRLTEELQTMENGYHDNPTLEVMETSSEMQEKKVNLNGELGDSWIVPLDTLMKEDLEEEEDTHL
ncbi:podocalyxin [Indicator indicator]|uniref:podocalyxin n=1 Tax=Indicator indicator TaxID=1002788 RepID=UPI0023DFBACE|nr:podocalyxin [Indicator indicator]